MEQARANRIIAAPNKYTHEDLRWQVSQTRAVAEFEVPIENDIEEQVCLAGQYNPKTDTFKLQLLAGEREPVFRFESDKRHHCVDCCWIDGPHINRPTDEDPQHGESEAGIAADDILVAIRQFAQRVNIQLHGAVHPPVVQRELDL